MDRFLKIFAGTILIASLIISASCTGRRAAQEGQPSTGGTSETTPPSTGQTGDVSLTTSDGFTLAGSYVPAEGDGPHPALLLVHQYGKDKSSFASFQEKLKSAGIGSLALDLRGHGGSTANDTINYRDFREPEWTAAVNDVKAGLDWLRTQPTVDPTLIGVVGASIGANLAVIEASAEINTDAENPPKLLVLLSPGLNYTLRLDPMRARELGHMPVYIVSAMDDTQSYRGSQTISQAARGGELHDFEGSDHGTDLFSAHPELMDSVIEWINGRIAGVAGSTGPEGDQPTDIGQPAESGQPTESETPEETTDGE